MTTSTAANSLGFGLELPLSHDQAVERVTAALKEQGFGVLTTIDVRVTLKEKLGEEFRPYTILGACNPPLAYRALSTNLEVGLMLPCNVVVYELDSESSRVEFLDPQVALGVMGNQQLAPVAREAKQRLKHVAKSLTVHSTGGRTAMGQGAEEVHCRRNSDSRSQPIELVLD